MTEWLTGASHFLFYAASASGAALVIAGLVVLARFVGIKLPLDIATFVDDVLAHWGIGGHGHKVVNVAFLDREGKIISLSHLITVSMHNGSGGVYTLKAGFFRGCDGDVIRASAHVLIDYQDGLFQEYLNVGFDSGHDRLVVRSRFTIDEILARFNADRPEAAE